MSQILQWLHDTLSADSNTRVSAEVQLANAAESLDFGYELAKITFSDEIEVTLRQITGLVLRKYIKEHWGPYFATFKGRALTVEHKQALRQVIFQGLQNGDRKIRLVASAVICDISKCDWPDHYPTLLTDLVNLISGGEPAAVHGALTVLTDFVNNELSEDQFLPIARDLMPQLLNVLRSPDKYSPITRSRTINILRQCIEILFMVKESHKNIVKESITQLLPPWIETFLTILSQDVAQTDLSNGQAGWEAVSIRVEIFAVLDTILTCFHKQLVKFFPQIIQYTLQHLSSLEYYFKTLFLIDSDIQVPGTVEEPGVVISLPYLVSDIFEFLANARQYEAFKSFFVSNSHNILPQIFQATFFYGQMTTEDEINWEMDADAFIEDEDEDLPSYSLRVAAQDLTNGLVETFGKDALAALNASTWKYIEQSETEKNSSSENNNNNNEKWWKGYEACLALLGSVSEDLVEIIQDARDNGQPVPVNLELVFQKAVFPFMESSPMFLQGRTFIFASQYSSLLPLNMSESLINATINVLLSLQVNIPVKISAIRAARVYCRVLPKESMKSHIKPILSSLGPLFTQDSENVITLGVDTAAAAIRVDPTQIDTTSMITLTDSILTAWQYKCEDPTLEPSVCDFFETLTSSKYPDIYVVLSQSVLPRIQAALRLGYNKDKSADNNNSQHNNADADANEENVEPPLVMASVNLLENIISGLPGDILSPEITSQFIGPLFKLLSTTQDREITQNGLSIFSDIVKKNCSCLTKWTDEESGKTGIQCVLDFIAKLLDPTCEESGGLFVGELTLQLLRRASEIVLPVAPDLLKAFVSRLSTAKTSSFIQSLILPFAYLMHAHFDTVIDLLENTTYQDQNGLQILLSSWCDNHGSFTGYWNVRLSTTALTQILLSNKPILNSILVNGDVIEEPGDPSVILTRSMSKRNPPKYTSIPVKAKILKILISEYISAKIDNSQKQYPHQKQNIENVPSDDEDDDWEDDEDDFVARNKEALMLSDMLDLDGLDNFDDLDDPEDEDMKSDPIYQIEPAECITNVFKQTYSQDASSMEHLAATLDDKERKNLSDIMQS